MRFVRRLRAWLREYSLWVRQGRPRDRWIVTKRGRIEGHALVGWSLSGRFCRDTTVVGVYYDVESGEMWVGGYTPEELLAVRV